MPKRKRTNDNIINPLSHNEATIKQLQVAGLTENDLLPSTYIPGFPHRPLRPSHGPQQADNDEQRDRRKQLAAQRGRDAQEQHLGVLVAVILRSLDQGDLARAKRAFSLLGRTQVRSKPVDLRRQGLWTLGAEIIMRDGEADAHPQTGRWGSAANMPQLRAYLECLIRQYPYNRLHPTAISDLDFYPVLFGCEVYNAWVEHKEALQRLEADAETWSDDGVKFEPSDDEDDEELHLPSRERHLHDEKVLLKTQALATMRGLAARMDTLMENAPYNRSVEMLRLRGMVALYIGDLSVPSTVRAEERGRAKALFIRMRDQSGGGVVDGRVQRWIQDDDAYKDDDDDDDGLPVFWSLPVR